MATTVKYLDPKADLTFKKVFGNHPDLLISLLNALLPLKKEQQIESIEYLPAELVPVDPLHKDTIVDVRCKDIEGRQFVVEMQMAWTDAFKQRVLFNASKAYVSQAEMGYKYEDLQPVYSLNLVNEIFEKDMKEYKHNYRIVHDKRTKKVIEGLCFTFIELPKFKPHTMKEKRMTILWLRFLTEINDHTQEVPAELLENPEISKALEEVKISAFTDEELRAYDKFWDRVSSEKTLMEGRYDEGKLAGEAEKAIEIAKKMKGAGMDVETIYKMTGVSKDVIEEI
nr:Rpn family recombination-promoting nuclease/putative transposase [uncultured Prevotella sp.]